MAEYNMLQDIDPRAIKAHVLKHQIVFDYNMVTDIEKNEEIGIRTYYSGKLHKPFAGHEHIYFFDPDSIQVDKWYKKIVTDLDHFVIYAGDDEEDDSCTLL